VDNFLERVADAFEHLNNQHRETKKTLESQREELDTLRAMENTLRDALINSEKFSENVIESAKREAAALLAEARLSKNRAELEAAKLSDDLRLEIHELKASRDRLRGDLQLLLDTHSALLAKIPRAEDQPKPELPDETESPSKAPDIPTIKNTLETLKPLPGIDKGNNDSNENNDAKDEENTP
jgi:cell division initiation protein